MNDSNICSACQERSYRCQRAANEGKNSYKEYLNRKLSEFDFDFENSKEIKIEGWVEGFKSSCDNRKIYLRYQEHVISFDTADKICGQYWCNQQQLVMLEGAIYEFMLINSFYGETIKYIDQIHPQALLGTGTVGTPVIFSYTKKE